MKKIKNELINKRVIDRDSIVKGVGYTVLLSLIVSTVLSLLVLDIPTLKRAVGSINIKIFLLLGLTIFLSWVIAGLRIKILTAATGSTLSLKDGMLIYIEARFISDITPFATGGGPYQIYFLYKKGVEAGKASSVVLVQFVVRMIFLGLSTVIYLFFFNWAVSPGVIPSYLFYLSFGMFLLLVLLFIFFTFVPGAFQKVMESIISINRVKAVVKKSYRTRKIIVKARNELANFRDSMKDMAGNKQHLALAVLCTVGYYFTMFLIVPLILMGFGLQPKFFRAFVMQTIFYLVLPFMPTPGAAGIAEVGFASLFISFIPGNVIGFIMIIWRFFTFYLDIVIGGFFAIKTIGRREIPLGNRNFRGSD